MIAVDTSALIAILREEPEADDFLRAIAQERRAVMSAASLLETSMVLAGRARGREDEAFRRIDDTVRRARIAVVPLDGEQVYEARRAFREYGKGRHAAALNFGDCASYALAKTQGIPLLFKGEDFAKTDLEPAIRQIGR